MIKRLIPPLLAASGFGLLLIPGAKRLPSYKPTTIKTVKTIDDAVAACQKTGLQGWSLVAYAQQLVSRKFAIYSALNLWDSPNRAFLYGMGYCTQYNLALKNLLDQLGFTTKAVFSLKVKVFDAEDWTMGHTWLCVTINSETRDVCAGRETNEPVWPVFTGHPITLFLTHLGMILFCGVLEWRALLTGSQPPVWTFVPRLPQGS